MQNKWQYHTCVSHLAHALKALPRANLGGGGGALDSLLLQYFKSGCVKGVLTVPFTLLAYLHISRSFQRTQPLMHSLLYALGILLHSPCSGDVKLAFSPGPSPPPVLGTTTTVY